jgi:aspartyl-tRNA(Asn)/glutamyl-tRNA(Gln) amidotransferase subunit A
MKLAKEADKRYKEGTQRPLEGIPICLKDNAGPEKGSPDGSASHYPKVDSQVWIHLANVGCINLGKTNMNKLPWE